MRWTCPKCGKKLNISDEQLIANDGVIVCPQCLLQARQPIPKGRGNSTSSSSSSNCSRNDDVTPPKRKQDSIDFDTTQTEPQATPPPHKQRMKQANTSYRYTGLSGNSSGNSAAPKKKPTGKKKSKKKKSSDGMSAWGCLGRTIIFTLVLFAAYVFIGLLLEALQ